LAVIIAACSSALFLEFCMDLDELLAMDNQAAGRPAAESEKVFSVVEVSGRIKSLLEGTFNRISVEGEVTGLKPSTSGHVYFSLAEKDVRLTTQKLDCVIYRFASASRSGLQFRDGDRVIATGRITAWGGASKYQMSVDSVRQSGAGNLLQKLEELRRRLMAEGLFDEDRKRKIPFLPRTIGVVTSIRGAAVRDIVRTILMRYPARILVVDSLVQGDGAAAGIARGIAMLNQIEDVDVIIVGRGGGSLEDLWAFNEEVTVRAVAGSAKPIISAVGHEIDHVLTDDVADARAATPTAAGQMVVPAINELYQILDDRSARMKTSVFRQLDDSVQYLDDAVLRLGQAAKRSIELKMRRVDMLKTRLGGAHPARRLADKARHLETAGLRMNTVRDRLLERPQNRLEKMRLRIESFNPALPLERGFAIARRPDGSVIRSFADVTPGDVVDIRLKRGAIDCTVTAAHPFVDE
jgi:exodeoxyribonuclease VII large subunit